MTISAQRASNNFTEGYAARMFREIRHSIDASKYNYIKPNVTLENVAIANAFQFEVTRRRASRAALLFGQFCTAHAHKLLFLSFR